MTKPRNRVIRFRVNDDEEKLIDRLHERAPQFEGDTSKLIRWLIAMRVSMERGRDADDND